MFRIPDNQEPNNQEPNNRPNLITTMTREQVRAMYRDILGIDPDEITLPGQ